MWMLLYMAKGTLQVSSCQQSWGGRWSGISPGISRWNLNVFPSVFIRRKQWNGWLQTKAEWQWKQGDLRYCNAIDWVMSQRIQVASRARKGKKVDSALEILEGTNPTNTLILATYDSFSASDLQKCKEINSCCFKPLNL